MRSLMYVSRRRTAVDIADYDVANILAQARTRNLELELTGALVATPRHFAQLLEGPPSSVDIVMASIIRDPRHYDIRIAPVTQRETREFHRWALAYHGEASYVAEMVGAALDAPSFEIAGHGDVLRHLMQMFA